MGKAPSFQFYPADWQRDLSEHPLEIEGAWIRICCALWWSDDPGKATKPLTNWARVLRVGEKKSLSIINYLLMQNIAEVVIKNDVITISSRRMMKDEYIRNIRRSAGSMGGNPAFEKGKPNPYYQDKQIDKQKITPSSSSSSSKIKTIKLKLIFEDGKFKNIPPEIMEKWRQVAPGISIPAEIGKAELWVISNPDKVRSRWASFLSRWMVKAQEHYVKDGGNGSGQRQTPGTYRKDIRGHDIPDESEALNARYYAGKASEKAALDSAGGIPEADDVPDFQDGNAIQ